MSDASPVPLRSDLEALLRAGRFQEVVARHADAGAAPEARGPEALLLVATAHTRLGALAEAGATARAALDGFRHRVDDDGLMRAENLLGAIAFESGDLAEAARRFRAAQRLARRLDDLVMMARAANNLASIVHLQGGTEEARSLYREALVAYQRLGNRRGAAETWHNLGLVAREEGDLAGAHQAALHALRHAEGHGEETLLALVLTGRAETAVAGGDLAVADEGLERAARLAGRASDELGVAEVDRVRALSQWRRGHPTRALALAERARDAGERLGSPLLRAESASLAARVLAALGRHEEAARRRAEARERFAALGAERHLARLNAAP